MQNTFNVGEFYEWLKDNGEKYSQTMFWEYDDKFPLAWLSESVGETYSNFYSDYDIYDTEHDLLKEGLNEAVKDFLKEKEIPLTQTNIETSCSKTHEFMAEKDIYLDGLIPADLNLKELLANTNTLVDLYPSQEKSMNYEGNGWSGTWYNKASLEDPLEGGIISKEEFMEYDDFDGVKEDIKTLDDFCNAAPKAIKDLFKSQEYEIKDLWDKEKVETSPFLSSMNDELEGLTNGDGHFLTIHANMTFDDIITLQKGGAIEFTPHLPLQEPWQRSCDIGLYDFSSGCGSYMGVELEKPYIVPWEALKAEKIADNLLSIKGSGIGSFGYDLQSAYNLIDPSYDHTVYNEEEYTKMIGLMTKNEIIDWLIEDAVEEHYAFADIYDCDAKKLEADILDTLSTHEGILSEIEHINSVDVDLIDSGVKEETLNTLIKSLNNLADTTPREVDIDDLDR